MSSLRDVVVQRATVETAGGDFTVGPLTASDILAVFVNYRDTVQILFDNYQAKPDPAHLFVDMLCSFPDLVYEIIGRASLGADCTEADVRKVSTLDFGAQLTALETVGKLTVSSVGGLGNLATLVERLARNVSDLTAQAAASHQTNGLQTSESNVPDSSGQAT